MTGNTEKPHDNILEAKEKFDKMFEDMQRARFKIEGELVGLEKRRSELLTQRESQRDRLSELNDELHKVKALNEDNIQSLRLKVENTKGERNRLETRKAHLNEQKTQVEKEHEVISEIKREKDVRAAIKDEFHKREENRLNMEIELLDKQYEELKQKKAEFDEISNNDTKFTALKEENSRVRRELAKKEVELNNLNYKSFELENLQRLATKQKEMNLDQRKELLEEKNRLVNLFNEIKKTNELKVDRKLRENEAEEIRQLRAQVKLETSQLDNIKDKWNDINLVYIKLKIDLAHREALLSDYQTKIETAKQAHADIDEQLNPLLPEVKELKTKCDELANQNNIKKDELKRLKSTQEDKEKVLKGLKARYNYLNENFDLSKLVNNVNIEELQQVMNANSAVNNTIGELLNKWDHVKEFSKGI